MKKLNAIQLLRVAGFGSLAAVAVSPLHAQETYYYGGLSFGQSRARIDEPRITASLLDSGLATTTMSRDERNVAYKVFGGYQFHKNFAIEAGYFNLGQFGFTSTTVPAGTLDGTIKLQGVNLDLVGGLPITDKLSVIGRVGAQYAQARDTFRGTGAVSVLNANPSQRSTNYKFGAGLQYEITPAVLVRAEAERYRINDAVGNRGDVNLFSVSLVIPFGRTPASTPRISQVVDVMPAPAPAPAPVAVVVAPLPVAAPVPVERRRVRFAADSLFTFDQSTIKPEGRATLDRFAKELNGTRFDVITVEGHSDRLGSAPYNQALSVRRGRAVLDYLVTQGGIDAAKVSVVGKGESSAVTKPEDCKGTQPSARLIACLQPDRRVEVEVSGTR